MKTGSLSTHTPMARLAQTRAVAVCHTTLSGHSVVLQTSAVKLRRLRDTPPYLPLTSRSQELWMLVSHWRYLQFHLPFGTGPTSGLLFSFSLLLSSPSSSPPPLQALWAPDCANMSLSLVIALNHFKSSHKWIFCFGQMYMIACNDVFTSYTAMHVSILTKSFRF